MEEQPTKDYLEVDAPIPGQSYCCLSFVSPENVLESKERFFVKEFFKSLENNDLSTKYDDYLAMNSERLENEYHSNVKFKTSVRGLKIRGVYSTLDEAQNRAKLVQERDRSFHVFVGQVGYWLPWDPAAEGIENQEYLEKDLNELMKKYKENQAQKDIMYQTQVEVMKSDAEKERLEAKKALNTV